MKTQVLIIGGSFAGLSSALTLGRSYIKATIVDAGKPANYNVDAAHNVIYLEGNHPNEILKKAKQQLEKYSSINLVNDTIIGLQKDDAKTTLYTATTANGQTIHCEKIIIAIGVKDELPEIKGFKELWGKSIFHCPFCHGYEVKKEPVLIYTKPKLAAEMAQLISNWSNELYYINETPEEKLSPETLEVLKKLKVTTMHSGIKELHWESDSLIGVILNNNQRFKINHIFYRPNFSLPKNLFSKLALEFQENGLLKVDAFFKTNLPGIYAVGDCSSPLRAITQAMAAGMAAGALVTRECIM